jgi:hypothetical protein
MEPAQLAQVRADMPDPDLARCASLRGSEDRSGLPQSQPGTPMSNSLRGALPLPNSAYATDATRNRSPCAVCECEAPHARPHTLLPDAAAVLASITL